MLALMWVFLQTDPAIAAAKAQSDAALVMTLAGAALFFLGLVVAIALGARGNGDGGGE